ncbi:MAG: protein translocase subunit SecF [Bdellovibrio sp.]
MIEIVKNTNIKFTKYMPGAAIVSAIMVVASIILAATKMEYGVDFRGGAEIQVKFQQAVSLETVREDMEKNGFKGVVVQTIGEASDNEVLIKAQGDESNLNQITEQVNQAVTKDFSSQGAEVIKVDVVGPKAGKQLRLSGFQAMLWAMIAIMIYVALRFDFKYAPGAIVALFHDVSIVLGVYAITGTEFTLQTVAALLAVIGYSVNDTVIIYDRVRENEQKSPGLPLANHIDSACNETLARTILTSGTTILVSIVMFFIGGPAIHDFFLAITIGIIVGTYSSTFIAAPVTLIFNHFRSQKAQKVGDAVKA